MNISSSLSPVTCLENENDCPKQTHCVTIKAWKKLDDAINEVVNGITFADLVEWQHQNLRETVN